MGRTAEVKKGNLWETWADFLFRPRQWGAVRDLLRVIVRNDPLLWQRVYTWEQQAGGPSVPGGTLPPHWGTGGTMLPDPLGVPPSPPGGVAGHALGIGGDQGAGPTGAEMPWGSVPRRWGLRSLHPAHTLPGPLLGPSASAQMPQGTPGSGWASAAPSVPSAQGVGAPLFHPLPHPPGVPTGDADARTTPGGPACRHRPLNGECSVCRQYAADWDLGDLVSAAAAASDRRRQGDAWLSEVGPAAPAADGREVDWVPLPPPPVPPGCHIPPQLHSGCSVCLRYIAASENLAIAQALRAARRTQAELRAQVERDLARLDAAAASRASAAAVVPHPPPTSSMGVGHWATGPTGGWQLQEPAQTARPGPTPPPPSAMGGEGEMPGPTAPAAGPTRGPWRPLPTCRQHLPTNQQQTCAMCRRDVEAMDAWAAGAQSVGPTLPATGVPRTPLPARDEAVTGTPTLARASTTVIAVVEDPGGPSPPAQRETEHEEDDRAGPVGPLPAPTPPLPRTPATQGPEAGAPETGRGSGAVARDESPVAMPAPSPTPLGPSRPAPTEPAREDGAMPPLGGGADRICTPGAVTPTAGETPPQVHSTGEAGLGAAPAAPAAGGAPPSTPPLVPEEPPTRGHPEAGPAVTPPAPLAGETPPRGPGPPRCLPPQAGHRRRSTPLVEHAP